MTSRAHPVPSIEDLVRRVGMRPNPQQLSSIPSMALHAIRKLLELLVSASVFQPVKLQVLYRL